MIVLQASHGGVIGIFRTVMSMRVALEVDGRKIDIPEEEYDAGYVRVDGKFGGYWKHYDPEVPNFEMLDRG